MWGLRLSHVYGTPVWLFSVVNLFHVGLIIRPAERSLRVEESFFLPQALGKRWASRKKSIFTLGAKGLVHAQEGSIKNLSHLLQHKCLYIFFNVVFGHQHDSGGK